MECWAMISRTTLLRGIRLGLVCLAVVAGSATFAWAQLQQMVIMTNRDFSNGDTANSTYVQSFILQGNGISGVTVTPPNGGSPFQIPPGTGGGGPSFELDSSFDTLQDLQTAYPQGSYTLSLTYSSGGTDSVSLLFDAQPPTSFAIPTSPLPLATGVPYSSPTFSWNPVLSTTGSALGCEITDPTGFYKLAVDAPYDIGKMSWTPSVELLPDTPYNFDLSVYQQGTWGSNQQTVQGNDFTYYGLFGNTDITQFTTGTTAPEPGSISLLLAGGLSLAAFAWRRQRRAA
jgi:hypothetical protein